MFHYFIADVNLKYKYDRLVLEVPLPSRNEKCVFFLRPMLMTVGDLLTDLQKEDPGVSTSVLTKGMTQQYICAMQILDCLHS